MTILQSSTIGIFKDLQPKLKSPLDIDLSVELVLNPVESRPGILYKELSDSIIDLIRSEIDWKEVDGTKTKDDVIAVLLDFRHRKYARLACFHLRLHILWSSDKRFMAALARKPFDENYHVPNVSSIQKLLYSKVPPEFYLLPADNIPPTFLETILTMLPNEDFNVVQSHFNIQHLTRSSVIELIVEWIYLPISKPVVFSNKDLLLSIKHDNILYFPTNFESFDQYWFALKEYVYILELYKVQQELQSLCKIVKPVFNNKLISASSWHIRLAPISTWSAKKSFAMTELDIHLNTAVMSPKLHSVWDDVKLNDVVVVITFGSTGLSFSSVAKVVAVSKLLNGAEVVFKVQFYGDNADRYDAIYYGGHSLYRIMNAFDYLPELITPDLKQFIVNLNLKPFESSSLIGNCFLDSMHYYELTGSEYTDFLVEDSVVKPSTLAFKLINGIPCVNNTSKFPFVKKWDQEEYRTICRMSCNGAIMIKSDILLIKHFINSHLPTKIGYISKNNQKINELLTYYTDYTTVAPCTMSVKENTAYMVKEINKEISRLTNQTMRLIDILQVNKSHAQDLNKCASFIRYHVMGFMKKCHSQIVCNKISKVDLDKYNEILECTKSGDLKELVSKMETYQPCQLFESDEQKSQYFIKYCGKLYLTTPEYMLENRMRIKDIGILIYDECERLSELEFTITSGSMLSEKTNRVIIASSGSYDARTLLNRLNQINN
eukprot:NODE_790_length_4224_cov_0.400727.p1 type:complete len:718 gc:universal NODE_790_length_4224_cov_0.400727:1072-3225(+)